MAVTSSLDVRSTAALDKVVVAKRWPVND